MTDKVVIRAQQFPHGAAIDVKHWLDAGRQRVKGLSAFWEFKEPVALVRVNTGVGNRANCGLALICESLTPQP